MTTYSTTYEQAQRLRGSRTVTAGSPLRWLRYSWKNMTAAPLMSAMFGVLFTGACLLAYAAASALPLFSAAFLTVLLGISPFIAAAAYFVARRLERGERPSLRDSVTRVRARALNIGLFSLACAMILAAWIRLTGISFALYYGTMGTSASEIARVWTAGEGAPAMLIFLVLAGAVLSFTLFAVAAVSLPLIADRNVGVIEAVQRSLRHLRENKMAMVVWMTVVAALIGIAVLSRLVLMPVVFPLLAYATFHSYRQLSTS